MVRLTDRPDMTLDVYRGRKTTTQQQQQQQIPVVFFLCVWGGGGGSPPLKFFFFRYGYFVKIHLLESSKLEL